MEISGDYTFKAPAEKVWGILMNPDAFGRVVSARERS